MRKRFLCMLSACSFVICAAALLRAAASENQLKADLKEIARPRSTQDPVALRAIGDYLEKRFAACGFSVERQKLPGNSRMYENIVAVKQGSDPRNDRALLVTAHFDSVDGSPGADDNASGVAALLELARLTGPLPLTQTLKLVALNFEEQDGLGAKFYIQEAQRSGEKIAGVINLEMLGYRDKKPGSQRLPIGLASQREKLSAYAAALGYSSLGREMALFLEIPPEEMAGDFLAVVANGKSLELLSRFLQGARSQRAKLMVPIVSPQDGWMLPETRRSDHAAFWDAGYPALLLTDTADLRNPHYHKSTDTIETLDLEFLNENIQAIVAGIRQLMEGPPL